MFTLTKQQSTPKKAPKGKRLYAIGDVHGCYDEMIRLLGIIESDHASRNPKECIVVFLGDLIDRGPDSFRVIEHLVSTPPTFSQNYFLIGNHEEMFLRILNGDAELIKRWLTYGGRSCVESYGVNYEKTIGHSADTMQLMIKKKVPKAHVEFLGDLLESITFGNYVLVHAGVNPKKPLDEQKGRDMRWMREPFLSWKKKLDYRVIHGHTIESEITALPHRIGVDTGVYETGVLSAVRLEDHQIGLLNSDGLNELLSD